MRLIIAGSRNISADLVPYVLEQSGLNPGEVVEVVSGCGGNADLAGEAWAAERSIPVRRFPADWRAYGKSAGPRRNREMAAAADALVAVWDGVSAGTASMVCEAGRAGLRVYVWRSDTLSGGWVGGPAPAGLFDWMAKRHKGDE